MHLYSDWLDDLVVEPIADCLTFHISAVKASNGWSKYDSLIF